MASSSLISTQKTYAYFNVFLNTNCTGTKLGQVWDVEKCHFSVRIWEKYSCNETHSIEYRCKAQCQDCGVYRVLEHNKCERQGTTSYTRSCGAHPTVRANGYFHKTYHSERDCEQNMNEHHGTQFQEESRCYAWYGRWIQNLFNPSTGKIENRVWDKKHCTGTMIEQRSLDLNKCYSNGSDQTWKRYYRL